jgi:hypothetical protein
MVKPPPTSMARALLFIFISVAVTIVIAIFFSLAIIVLLSPRTCGDYGRALVMLSSANALLFVIGLICVGSIAYKKMVGYGRRIFVIAIYGFGMFAIFGFGLFLTMVAFNC